MIATGTAPAPTNKLTAPHRIAKLRKRGKISDKASARMKGKSNLVIGHSALDRAMRGDT